MTTNNSPAPTNLTLPEGMQPAWQLRDTVSYEGMRQSNLPIQEGVDNMPEQATAQSPNLPEGYIDYRDQRSVKARKVTAETEVVHTPTGPATAQKGDYVVLRQSNAGPYSEVIRSADFEAYHAASASEPTEANPDRS